ncbi:MAG: helix-turn-helix transcriptional regulator [Paramuribaculum sp.]|nr:helix-turn-helix transcriptional regulator [Paramuribaculum sp.]MDE6488409.1 helix-turn-helix transcriptional regulator [Paramuribaculum sp.]
MKIYQPRAELRPYVRYYWTLKSDEPFSVLTFPIGCPQIIFHKKEPLYIPELGESQSQFTISGQVNFPAHIQSAGRLEMIVAVFYPHTVGMFIDTPPSAFHNLEICGYDVGNRRLDETAHRIFDKKSHRECIDILENFLLSKIRLSLNIMRIAESIGVMLRSPDTTINTLAKSGCLGIRQYERVFRDMVGMNPKEYAGVVRFQKALWLMQNGESNCAGIAAECGYSDQSHFIRNFRKFSGYTPVSFSKNCAPYSDLFTNPA